MPTDDPLFRPVPACWVCGSASLSRWNPEEVRDGNPVAAAADPVLAPLQGRPFWLARCRACGFAQPEVLPAHPDYFDHLYDQPWTPEFLRTDFDTPYKDTIFRTVLRGLARRLPPGRRRLLDVGTHNGRMLAVATAAGWDAAGVELNPRAAAFAAAETGRPVHRENAKRLADTGHRYDAVVLTDVLEHIPEPAALLADLRRLLAPGGVVAVKVPNGPAQRLKERLRARVRGAAGGPIATSFVHCNHFHPPSLRLALTRAGFADVSVGPGAPEYPPVRGPWTAVSAAIRAGVYAAARLPGAARTPLALNLQAFARAPGGTA